MATFESVAYLKGLMDGLGLDDDKKETKIFRAIVDVLDDLSIDVDDLTEGMEILAEEIDDINEDVDDIAEDLYGEDFDSCDCGCCDEDEEFEVECPNCNTKFVVDGETAYSEDSFNCPSCGEKLEFEFDDDCDCSDCEE